MIFVVFTCSASDLTASTPSKSAVYVRGMICLGVFVGWRWYLTLSKRFRVVSSVTDVRANDFYRISYNIDPSLGHEEKKILHLGLHICNGSLTTTEYFDKHGLIIIQL